MCSCLNGPAARSVPVSRKVDRWLEMTRQKPLRLDPSSAVLAHRIQPDKGLFLPPIPDPATPLVSALLRLLIDACPRQSSHVSRVVICAYQRATLRRY
jgi:hypothetical protein